MKDVMNRRVLRPLLIACLATGLSGGLAWAQVGVPSAPAQPSGGQASSDPGATKPGGTTAPTVPMNGVPMNGAPAPSPSTPNTSAPAPSTPSPATPSPATPSPATPNPATPGPSAPGPSSPSLAPPGTPENTEIERGSPGIPNNATTEDVVVPGRPVAMLKGQSSYDDAFKSIKSSIDTVRAAMDKAGLKPSGHPITVFSEPDDKGFKFQAAIPMAAAPAGKADLGNGVTIGMSPAGKAIKFQHRGAYDDIDSTYDVITAYLDAKGMQVDNPYIEEYLTDLTTADDPNLQIDIYVFVKK